MTKFLSIIGTRPQYAKVLENLKSHVICDTGQHYDANMSAVFKKQLKLKPKYSLGATTFGEMYDGCVKIIEKEKPDVVIVYGDTRSTLAGALAAKFCKKTIAHVEAGLRSFDMTQPEEVVRVIVDRIASIRFCPDENARKNLLNEGIFSEVYVVGDPLWDSLNRILPIPRTKDYGTYNVLTIHREQNDSKQFVRSVFSAIEKSGERAVFPCHPRMKSVLRGIKVPKNLEIIEPLGYKEMISLITNCRAVLTDSGGITREASWFLKPVIILRSETEWQGIVDARWAVCAGGDTNRILYALQNHLPNPKANPPTHIPVFGAKSKIEQILNG